MVEKLKSIGKKLAYAGVTKEAFYECKEEIQRHNGEVLGKVLIIAGLLFALFAILGSWVPGFSEVAAYYMLFLIITIGCYAAYWYMRRMDRECKFGYCYGFVLVLFTFCMIKEVFIHTEWPGTLFHVVLLGTFALFLMPFWHEVCFGIAISVVYLICTFVMKDVMVFQLEAANVIVSLCAAVLLSYVVDRERLNYILSKRQLTDSSTVDELTGVNNRRDFNKRIIGSYEVERKLSLAMIDVDNFKSYNDTYGHLAGDKCLHQIGAILREIALENGCYVARYGGEEFVLLGEGMHLSDMRRVAWKTVSEVRKMKMVNEKSPLGIITISVGIAEKDCKRMKAYTDIISEADDMLYRAKESGKNRVVSLEDV